MCTNYEPSHPERFRLDLDWQQPTFTYKPETYPSYFAPMRILAPDSGEPELREAKFGLVPFWSKEPKLKYSTMNARAETVARLSSYREPWKKRRYALVPMAGFYEPDYETGRPVRWRIERKDKRAFTVAAIWDYWKSSDGEGFHSFALLTLNADGHPVMGRFHAPHDEKRSLVIVSPERCDDWLHTTAEEAGNFMTEMPADEFTSLPAPKPSKQGPDM